MSSNILTFTCIGADVTALTALHRQLESAVGQFSDQWPETLQACFDDWEKPFVSSASLRGETLRFVIDSSTGDELEKSHLHTLHAAGATHIRVRTWYGQVAETRTTYWQAGKKVSAKAFPAPMLTVEEQFLELLLDGKEAAFAKAIKGGASPDAVVDGRPLLVHAAKARLSKAVAALVDAGVDLVPCQNWIDEVAEAVQYCGSKKVSPLLRALVESPQADAVALWRSPTLLVALCDHPQLLGALASREGVDVNAQIRCQLHPTEVCGSLLFNSVLFFRDNPAILAVLEKFGARSVPPPTMSDQRRLERLFWGERDAGTVAGLVAAGVNLDGPLWDDRPVSLLRHLLLNPTRGCRSLTLANELLAAGANADFLLTRDGFQLDGLRVFDAMDRLRWADSEWVDDRPFVPERDGGLVVEFLVALLARGLDANLAVSLCLRNIKSDGRDRDRRYAPLHWRGPLLGAVALFLCGRGSDLRSICLPLVELLLRHGASPDAEGALVVPEQGDPFREVDLHGDWTSEMWHSHAPTGTVRGRLRERQAQAPDEVDATVLALMERAGAMRP